MRIPGIKEYSNIVITEKISSGLSLQSHDNGSFSETVFFVKVDCFIAIDNFNIDFIDSMFSECT